MPKPVHLGLRKLSALRAQIEAFAAREAVSHVAGAPERLTDLHLTLARLKQAVRKHNYEAFRAADFRLHEIIIEMAEVPLLPEVWRILWDGMAAFHHQTFRDYFPDAHTLSEEHDYLVVAISHQDPDAAEDAARSHLEAIWMRIAERQSAPMPDSDPLQRAVAHLAFRYRARVSLRDVASKVAFTSAGNLSRLFRIRYGLSFQNYLQKLRMEKAAELLAQTQIPIALICRRVGYRDHSRFGQHFKRRFNVAPRVWRATQQEMVPRIGKKLIPNHRI